MKIHTDKLTGSHLVRAAADIEGVFVDYIQRGSRSRDHAFNISLYALPRKGRRLRNSGIYGATDDAAATWDEWGMFIDDLFRTDPDAVIGEYRGYEDFKWQTGNRYDTRDFTPCNQHNWSWGGPFSDGTTTCAKNCGAVRRTRQAGVTV